MSEKNKRSDVPTENMPAPIENDVKGDEVMVVGSSELASTPDYELAQNGSELQEASTTVHEFEHDHCIDESMRGGYASVKGKRLSENRLVWIIVAVMTALCIAVGVCSSVLTGYFMRKGEKPPVINTSGNVQQNIAAVISARKSSIAELSCGGLKGSGIVMKRDGGTVYVITNAHVLEGYVLGGRKPAVKFFGEDGFYEASVVGYDAYYDVAVVSLVHDTVYTVYDLDGSEFFSPDVKYNEGDHVVSIGNAMGMGIASYEGIISRASELLECDELFNAGGKKTVPVMRTTAVINAGMSGGGVFDMHGNLVGLGTYRMSNSAGVDTEGGANTDVEDTGFATPVSVLYPVYKRIMADAEGGAVGLLRVRAEKTASSVGDIPSEINWLALPFGFNCEYRNGKLTVASLDAASPAAEVSVGDVVTQIGGSAVTDDVCSTVGTLLRYHRSGNGAALRFTLERDGAPVSVAYENYRYAV